MAYLASVVGLSGSGKTTVTREVSSELAEHDLCVASFHDRTTGFASQKIDSLIQGETLSPEARFYLFLAARREVIDQYIIPAMQHNDVVLTDRYFPCTIAYQAYGEGLNRDLVASMSIRASHGAIPNKVFVLDVSPEESQARMANRGENPQIFDSERLAFHGRVRQGYLEQASDNPNYMVINGTLPVAEVTSIIGQSILHDMGLVS